MYDVEPLDLAEEVPSELLQALAELRIALEVSPWTVGRPLMAGNPAGMRVTAIGGGRVLVYFGVLERERRVALFDLVVL